MLREGYLVKIFFICICESLFTILHSWLLFLVSSTSLCAKYNYKIKAAGKTFDIESESDENNLGSYNVGKVSVHGPHLDVYKI